MATSEVKVTNWPKDEGSGSRERVAFDLAVKIHSFEHGYGKGTPENPRQYWLKLYADSISTVYGREPPK